MPHDPATCCLSALHATDAALDNSITGLDMRVHALENEVPDVPGTGAGVTTEAELRAAVEAGGRIEVDGPITLSSYVIITRKGTTIRGGPNGGRLMIDSQDSSHVLVVSASDVTIEDLELTSSDGIKAGAPFHRGIAIGRDQAWTNLRISRCHIHHIASPIRLDGAAASPAIQGIRIEGCRLESFTDSGIMLNWNAVDVDIIGNTIRGRLEGETHKVEHNGIWIGNECVRVRIRDNTITGSDRWGIEEYFCRDASVTGNHIEHCENGISMGGGVDLRCVGNTIKNFVGAVGAIELIGGICTGNIIDGGAKGICGIACNTDASPGVSNVVANNRISNCAFPIQCYKSAANSRVVDSIFEGNQITGLFRNGSYARGIFFNAGSAPAHDRNTVQGNVFIGIFDGCVYLYGGSRAIVKNNTQIATNLSGETQRRNNFVFLNGGIVTTDAAGTWQTTAGFTDIGTNLRMAP